MGRGPHLSSSPRWRKVYGNGEGRSAVRFGDLSGAACERRCSDMPLSLEEKVRLLSMVDVFELLSREELEELAHRASDAHLRQGEDLRTRQKGGGKLYAVKEGRVQLY